MGANLFRRFTALITASLLLFSYYAPLTQIRAESLSPSPDSQPAILTAPTSTEAPTPTSTPTATVVPTTEPTATPILTPSPETSPIVEPTTSPVTSPEATPADNQGKISDEGISTSASEQKAIKFSTEAVYENVIVNKDYSSLESGMALVTFTKLPTLSIPITLTIKKITVASQINGDSTLSDAYDISTEPKLETGSFSADIKLKLKNSIDQDKTQVTVDYSEDQGLNFTGTENVKTLANDVATFTVDHFTVFVITPVNPTANTNCRGLQCINPGFVNDSSNVTTGGGTTLSHWTYRNESVINLPIATRAKVSFVDGPATVPIGTGSAHLQTGIMTTKGVLGTTDYAHLKLSDVNQLGFSVYVTARNNGNLIPYLSLYLDLDHNGVFNPLVDDIITYDGSINPGVAPSLNTWYSLDAYNGHWASSFGHAASTSGTTTFATIKSAHPNAEIINPGVLSPTGGVKFNVGDLTTPSWAHFDGNIDKFTINSDVIDFELVPDTEAPVLSFTGFKDQASASYDNSQTTKPCGSYNNTGYISWEWVLTNTEVEPVTYTYTITNGPTAVGYTANTTNTHYNGQIPMEGTYDVSVYGTDYVGNVGTPVNCTVTYDSTRPTVDLVFPIIGPAGTSFQAVFSEDVVQTEAENPANYFLTNWPTAGSSGDLVGDASIVYDSLTHTATITFSNPGWYISPEQLWGVQNIHDLAGNIQSVTPYTEYSTPMTAPVTSDTGTDANWHNTDVTVNFNCTDPQNPIGTNGSGCYQTWYQVDGAGYVLGNSVTISSEGIHTVNYYSTDMAGNSETPHSTAFTVKIDKTAPILPGNPGWGENVPPVSYQGNGSGITNYVPCNGFINNSNLFYRGLWGEATDTYTQVSYERQVVYNNNFVWQGAHSNNYTGTFQAHAGADANGGEGVYYVRVRAIDGVGNKTIDDTAWADHSTYTSWCKLTIDLTPPAVPTGLTFKKQDGTVLGCNGYSNNKVGAYWNTNTDPDFDHYQYASYNPPTGWIWYNTNPLTNPEYTDWGWNPIDATYGFMVRAVDKAGNASNWTAVPQNIANSCRVTIDRVAPEKPTAMNSGFTHNADYLTTLNWDVKFHESVSTDAIGYEYQFNSYDLTDPSQHWTGLVNLNSYGIVKSCVFTNGISEDCQWQAQMQQNRKWISRMRAYDNAGNYSSWTNWDTTSISDFGNIAANRMTYANWDNNLDLFAPANYDKTNGGLFIREEEAPVSSITNTVPLTTNNPSLTINYTVTDLYTKVKQVKLFESYNGGAYSEIATNTSATDSSFELLLERGDGEYCFYTRAEDVADNGQLDSATGNVEADKEGADYCVTLDRLAPIFIAGPANPQGPVAAGSTYSFTASDAGRGDNYITKIDLFVDGAVTPTQTTTNANPSLITFTANWNSTGLLNGDHTIKVCASDAAGNNDIGNHTTLPTVTEDECYQFTLKIQNELPVVAIAPFSMDEANLSQLITLVNANTTCDDKGLVSKPCDKLQWDVQFPGGAWKPVYTGKIGTFTLAIGTQNENSIVQNYVMPDTSAKINNFFVDDPLNPIMRVSIVAPEPQPIIDATSVQNPGVINYSTAGVTLRNVAPSVTLNATSNGNSTSVNSGGTTPTLEVTAGNQVNFSGSFSDLAGNFDAGSAWQARMNYGGTGFFGQTITQTSNTTYNVSINPRTYVNGYYNTILRICEENNLYGSCSTATIRLHVTGGTSENTGSNGENLNNAVGGPSQEQGSVLGLTENTAAFTVTLPQNYFLKAGVNTQFSFNVSGTGFEKMVCNWNFGDGSDVVKTTGPAQNILSHTYSKDGTFTLGLNCTDAQGKVSNASSAVLVGDNAAADYNAKNGNVKGDSTSSPAPIAAKNLGTFISENLFLCVVLPLLLLLVVLGLVFNDRRNKKKQETRY